MRCGLRVHIYPFTQVLFTHMHCNSHGWGLQSKVQWGQRTMYIECSSMNFQICAQRVHIKDLVGRHFQFERNRVKNAQNAVRTEHNLNYFARLLWLCSCSYLALPAWTLLTLLNIIVHLVYFARLKCVKNNWGYCGYAAAAVSQACLNIFNMSSLQLPL